MCENSQLSPAIQDPIWQMLQKCLKKNEDNILHEQCNLVETTQIFDM